MTDQEIRALVFTDAQIKVLEDQRDSLRIDLRLARARECRMREALDEWLKIADHLQLSTRNHRERTRAALTASSPCPHAGEVERLKLEIDALNGKPEAVHMGAQAALAAVKQCVGLHDEVKRLRKVLDVIARGVGMDHLKLKDVPKVMQDVAKEALAAKGGK